MAITTRLFLRNGFGQALWMDLVNSEEHDGFGHRTEHLADTSWMRVFTRFWGLDLPGNLDDARTVKELRELRSLLRTLSEQWNLHKSISASGLAKLNECLAAPVRRVLRLERSGYGLSLVSADDGWRWIHAQVAASLAEQLSGSEPDRIKRCPNPDCGWLFLDKTRANSRKWCRDRRCGNRLRVRLARQRASVDR
jgi:predicted RNA-binding Zn ribbon-like protein